MKYITKIFCIISRETYQDIKDTFTSNFDQIVNIPIFLQYCEITKSPLLYIINFNYSWAKYTDSSPEIQLILNNFKGIIFIKYNDFTCKELNNYENRRNIKTKGRSRNNQPD